MGSGPVVGICGGIGSGKSVVSRLLRLGGYPVYDCDSEARRLMAESPVIKRRIRDEISAEVTDGESLPRRDLLARIVFSDDAMRKRLNAIVHGAVRKDFLDFARRHQGAVFVEAAILAESGLADICRMIWRVESDPEQRLKRVIRRDGCSESQTRARMEAQRHEETLLRRYADKTSVLTNDAAHSLMRQIDTLLECFNSSLKFE